MLFGTIFGILLSVGLVAHAEENAHTVADHVDASAHKAKRKITHHVRKAKTDVKNSTDDNSVRKAGRRAKDAGNDALDKVDDTVHGH